MDSLQPRSPVSPHQVEYFSAICCRRLTEVFCLPGNSPSSTPVSVKSPVTGTEEDEADPPQLSVKREFTIKRGRETENG